MLCRARSITLLWQLSKNEQIPQLSKNGLSTRYSQPVTHASTNRARRCLTSQIGRDGVCSAWYGPSPPAATLYQQLYEEGRGCAPRALPGVALTACHALGRAVARARTVTCMAGGRLSAAQQAKKEEQPLRAGVALFPPAETDCRAATIPGKRSGGGGRQVRRADCGS